jgi:hypothetical protein
MIPVELGNKDRCAGEDQQQFSSQSAKDGVLCVRVDDRGSYAYNCLSVLFWYIANSNFFPCGVLKAQKS